MYLNSISCGDNDINAIKQKKTLSLIYSLKSQNDLNVYKVDVVHTWILKQSFILTNVLFIVVLIGNTNEKVDETFKLSVNNKDRCYFLCLHWDFLSLTK